MVRNDIAEFSPYVMSKMIDTSSHDQMLQISKYPLVTSASHITLSYLNKRV
jgi:hypothetical protein